MSCIEKMIIQGIRSFGPSEDDKQMITFFTPLTLILGPNGTGKTTIIECLKYITTGDMPPGATKNAAFIHDPKVIDETEVNAQIRLQFRSLKGQLFNVTRSIRAIQKAKNIQMKTLEGVLTRKDPITRKNISISSKCSELDNEMVSLLGVAKPILDSVIFCHQEDSNWPLSEGKVLKTRFDDIFASTRYVRALDSIRKTAKDQDIEIKLCQNDIRFLKQNRDKAKQLQADLDDKTIKYEVACDDIEKIQKEMQPIIEQLNKLKSRSHEIYEIQTKIEKMKTEQKQISKSMTDLKANIRTLFSGSTDELKQAINDFESELLRKKNRLERCKQQIEIYDKKIEKMNEEKASLLIDLRLLKEESERYKDNKQMRNEQIMQLAKKYRISGYTGKLSDSQVQEFVGVLDNKKTSLKLELQSKKAALEEQEEIIQSEIDQLRKKQTKLETELSMKNETKNKNIIEIRQIKQKLNSMEASGEHLKQLRTELESSEEELKESEDKLDIPALQEEVQTLASDKKKLESKLKSLDEELNQLTHESSIRSKLAHLKKDRTVKSDSLHKLVSSNEDSLTYLLGSMPKENLRKELNQCLSKLSSQRSKTDSELQKLKQEKTKNETQLNMLREQLRNKEAEINKYQDRLSAVSGSDNFDLGLEKVQAELRKAQDEKGNLKGIQYMYKKYQDTLAKDDPPCPLCHRPFDSRDEVDELVSELEKKMSLVPSKLESVCSKIEKNKKKVEELIQLKPIRESMQKLQEEIPRLKEKIQSLRKQIDSLEEKITEKEEEFGLLLSDEQTAQSMQGDVQQIDKLKLEIQNADREIQQLSSKLSTSDNCRSIQDVQDDRSSLQDEIELINRKLERKQKKINDDLEKINNLRATINTKRSEVIQIEQDLHQRTSLEEKKTVLEQSNRSLEQEIKDGRIQLHPLCGDIKEKEKQKDQIILQKEKENEEGSKQMNKLTEEIQRIIQLNHEIERYVKEGKNEQIKVKEASITKATQDIQEASERKNKMNRELDEMKDDISTNEIRKREMSDNLRLHEMQKENNELQQRIQNLTEELGGLDVDNLMKEQHKYEADYDRCRQQKSQADSRKNRYEEGIHFLKRELNDEAYKDAEKKYTERMIDLKTIEQAKMDLNKYYKALDKTIMRYHYNKMAEINKIIRQLWVNTYKGNDIETIEIRFDDDDEGTGRQKTRRTFNYRVIMIKNEVAVDMRNRCSAGQKVLASIIIRLALAECFCINCGVLALDEPTTNLDRENIESLAQALVEIIKTRSRQRNFQLIVITHDEDFVELLGRSEYVDEFFKVRKNASGYSQLVKARVEDLHSR